MTRRTAVERFGLIVFSAVLAVLLWLQVSALDDQVVQQSFRVPLQLRGLPESLAAVNPPLEVDVIAEGRASLLRDFETDAYSANVDLRSAKQGEQRLRVNLSGPTLQAITVVLKSPTALINLSAVVRKSFPVTVAERGRLASDLEYGGAVTEPEHVTLSGPASLLARVREVRVFLDLSKLRTGETPVQPVEIVATDGGNLSEVRAEPGTVTIRPRVAAAPATLNVLVAPRWKGNPPFGYQVDGFEVVPNQITISGEVRVLTAVQTLWTEAIDLSGLRQSKSFTVPIQFPSGIRPTEVREVRVNVRINRVDPATP